MINLKKIESNNMLPWFIISFGIILRLASYLYNRSLRLDEAMLSVSILERSFTGLLNPLDYHQGAPLGFLMLEKAVVHIWSNSEYALRLIPFISSVFSLILFYSLAKRVIAKRAVPYALCLFAISGPVIFCSTDVKQYSSDILICIFFYLNTLGFSHRNFTWMQVLGIGTTGAIMIWFSHPVVFIMAGFGIALTLSSFFRQNWKEIFRQITTYAIWMSSFLVCYVFSLQKLAHDELQLSNFKSTFMPLPPTSISDMRWFLDNLFTTFNNPGGLFFTGLAALVFGVGIVSLYKQKRTSTLMLLLPIPVLLMVSGFHKYPFQDRLLLFIAPIIMLFIAEGLTQIRQITKEAFPAIGIILIFLLFLHPLITATYHLFVPVKIEEIKPVIKYMENNKQGGDTLYLYYSAEPAYRYYSQYLNIEGGKPIIGISSRNNVSKYWDDLDKLRGRGRVWILFSHICTWNGTDEKQHFLSYLDKKGKKIESFVGDGASIYLYSL